MTLTHVSSRILQVLRPFYLFLHVNDDVDDDNDENNGSEAM